MALSIRYEVGKDGAWANAMKKKYGFVAFAAQSAMVETGNKVKADARAAIAAAGFSRRWQNALRVDIYPKKGFSAGAAAVVHINSDYAGVFEQPTTIDAKSPKLLWLPLPTAPKSFGNEKVTPALYAKRVGPLQYVRRLGKPPLLVAKLKVAARQVSQPRRKVSIRALRRGLEGKGKTISLPIFIGVERVKINKHLGIRAICATARDGLARVYFEHFVDG